MPTKREPAPLPEMQKENIYQAYILADSCQNACNLSVVALSFAEAMPWIWTEARAFGQGTDYLNHHPVATLFLAKLMELNGSLMDSETYNRAARRVGFVRCLGPRWMGTFEHSEALDEAANRDSDLFPIDPRD